MKLHITLALLLAVSGNAFAPGAHFGARVASSPSRTARSFGLDPSAFQDLHQHVDSIRDAFTSLTLSDLDASSLDVPSAGADTSAVVDAAGDADAAVDAAGRSSGGWFGFLTGPIQGLLVLIHSAVAVAAPSNAWGISIVLLTLLVKLVTFPLTKTQLESTNKMQALQPTIKEIQAKYQSNPEVMNQKIADVYQTNEVNPLAGCLPSLAQIPVFIGLYRSVLNLAAENRLDEPFLFLPSLEGPTFGADPTKGTDWLFANWQNGAPSMGWEGTIPYLILPVFLVISQYVSMQLMQPKTEDPQQQQANVILKVLPIMIGWFALNVPSALCIYWVVNNIVTTATTLAIRNSMQTEPAMAGGGAASAPPQQSIFAPPPIRDTPAGFGSSFIDEGDGKPLTAIDVEVESKTTTKPKVESTPEPKAESKPEPKVVESQPEVEVKTVTQPTEAKAVEEAGEGMASKASPPRPKKKKRGKKKKRKN